MKFLPSLTLFNESSESRFKLLAKYLPNEAKEIIKNYKGTIYAMCIGDSLFLFRPLKQGEFQNIERIIQLCGSYELEEFILSKTLLWPSNPDKILATYPGKLTRVIIDISGWNNIEAFKAGLAYARNEFITHNRSFNVLLRTTFGLKEEDVDNLEFLDRMHLIAWAEVITKKDFLAEPKQKKEKIAGLNIDSSGLEGAIKTVSDSKVVSTDKMGRPVREQESETTIIYNTRLSKRDN